MDFTPIRQFWGHEAQSIVFIFRKLNMARKVYTPNPVLDVILPIGLHLRLDWVCTPNPVLDVILPIGFSSLALYVWYAYML